MPNYKRFVERVQPPMEAGEKLLDARLCMIRGAMLRRGLTVGFSVGAANTGSLTGAEKSITKGGLKAAAKLAGRPIQHPQPAVEPSEADRLPPGNFVLAVTNRRYRVFAHTEGWWKGSLTYLRDEPLDWIADAAVAFRMSAPALQVTFRDESTARLELPRQWGANPKTFAALLRDNARRAAVTHPAGV